MLLQAAIVLRRRAGAAAASALASGAQHQQQRPSTYVPIVIEQDRGRERAYDIYSRLLKECVARTSKP